MADGGDFLLFCFQGESVGKGFFRPLSDGGRYAPDGFLQVKRHRKRYAMRAVLVLDQPPLTLARVYDILNLLFNTFKLFN